MKLPKRIFFTGVPGSKWSGIAQILETMPGMNISDRSPEREYNHHNYTGHRGAYFGPQMEFESILDTDYIDKVWTEPGKCRLIKSHEWSYYLGEIREKFPNDWIMMVYRPDMSSYAWWHEVGGFQIKYPNYTSYKNSGIIFNEIIKNCKKKTRLTLISSSCISRHMNIKRCILFLNLIFTLCKLNRKCI
jgi:hypothetical protein